MSEIELQVEKKDDEKGKADGKENKNVYVNIEKAG